MKVLKYVPPCVPSQVLGCNRIYFQGFEEAASEILLSDNQVLCPVLVNRILGIFSTPHRGPVAFIELFIEL